jgi:uncharacterized protein
MNKPASDVAFTPAVKAEQQRRGSRTLYQRMEEGEGWETTITPELAAFIADRDSFYLATASADGQPYIQHRGGPKGVLSVLDETTLGFADLAGNKQFITLGNLAENDRAFLFLMDYARRRRVKIWGHARCVEGDRALVERLLPKGSRGRAERAILFRLVAWDVNCPQYIPQKVDAAEVRTTVDELRARIERLKEENGRLRQLLAL